MPGLFVMTMAFGIGNTMTVVATDIERGVMDRFRSMPIAPRPPSCPGGAWRTWSNSCAGLAITIACGVVVGWSWHDGLPSAAAAVTLLLLLRFACVWIGIWLGLMVGSPEAAGAVWGLLFPLTMITSAFVAPELMPGWLGTVAEWNPLSSTVGRDAGAVRQRFDRRRIVDRDPRGVDGRRLAGRDPRRSSSRCPCGASSASRARGLDTERPSEPPEPQPAQVAAPACGGRRWRGRSASPRSPRGARRTTRSRRRRRRASRSAGRSGSKFSSTTRSSDHAYQ